MSSQNPGQGFEADDRAIGMRLPPRKMERALAQIAGAKPDGASLQARRQHKLDSGVVAERAYLASLGLSGASVRRREEALAERALRAETTRDPETRDGRRRARSED